MEPEAEPKLNYYEVTFPNLVDWQLDYIKVLQDDVARFIGERTNIPEAAWKSSYHGWVSLPEGDYGLIDQLHTYTALFSLTKKGLLIMLENKIMENPSMHSVHYFLDGKHQIVRCKVTWPKHDPNAWTTLKAINPNDYV